MMSSDQLSKITDEHRSQVKTLKKELKAWEHKFVDDNGRKPDKQDIAGVPEMAKKYKYYAKLKAAVDKADTTLSAADMTTPTALTAQPAATTPSSTASRSGASSEQLVGNQIPPSRLSLPRPPADLQTKRASQKPRGTSNRRAESGLEQQSEPLKESTPRVSVGAEAVPHQPQPLQQPGTARAPSTKASILDKSYLISAATLSSTNSSVGGPADASSPLSHLAAQKKYNDAVAAPAQIAETQATRQRGKKTIASGAMTTADLGQSTNKFMRRIQQQQEINKTSQELPVVSDSMRSLQQGPEPKADEDEIDGMFANVPGYSVAGARLTDEDLLDGVDVSGMTAIQVQDFLNRRRQIMGIQKQPQQNSQSRNSLTTRSSSAVADATQGPPVAKHGFTAELQGSNDSTCDTGALPGRKSSSQDVSPGLGTSPLGRSDEETSPTVVTGDAIQPVTSNQANIPELASPTAQTPGGNVINVSKLPSIVTSNFFLRLQRDGVLRCRLTRRKNLLDKANPTYLLFNEVENKFLLSARKKLISKSVSFIISDSQEDISKDSPHYLAKLKANYKRNSFILTDARSANKQRDLACVNYSKNVLPRELQVVVSATEIDENAESGFSTDIMADLKSKSTNKLLFLKNKTPRWNEATQSHCLNFGGRVTQPSIKNMQLITDEDENYIVLQFGRCGPDLFTLDVRWPMTPVEAFAIALSTFEAYDKAAPKLFSPAVKTSGASSIESCPQMFGTQIFVFLCLVAAQAAAQGVAVAWMGGNATMMPSFGTVGVPSPSNWPPARMDHAMAADTAGNIWMFGGRSAGNASGGPLSYTYNTGIADLWKYTPNSGQWTWMSGVANISDPGVTESRGVASARNRPPARSFHSMWASSDGSVFIFGGHSVTQGPGNDLWKFAPAAATWTLVSGSSAAWPASSVGTL
ncbi:hypothetical protein HK105_202850 [Polyrhizophydium stewartii]|uniref:Tubby C-terminal domain-containing protein n=1 Tax=Polyrhizophydium stewartii TaxID=2732419 RepID=A0ABR4NDH6_9FUNG